MKNNVFARTTILSVTLFEIMIVVTTFTPYGGLRNANYFGNKGMLYTILVIALMYGIPLVFYKLGIIGMKYILAVIIGVATLGAFVVFILMGISAIMVMKKMSLLVLTRMENLATIITGVICIYTIASNFIWYINVFSIKQCE